MEEPASSPKADYYRFISAMGKQAMKEKEAKGMRMRRPPLGWRIVRIDGEPYLEPDPVGLHVRAAIADMAASGLSVRKICKELTAKGFRNGSGKPFASSTVHHLLSWARIAQ